MKIINRAKLINSIFNKYQAYPKKADDRYDALYRAFTRDEIDLIITQDYPRQTRYSRILRRLKEPIEELEIEQLLLGK